MRRRNGPAGTLATLAGSFSMRALIVPPLLLLAACGDKDGGKPAMSTNIVDEQASYDVDNRTPAQDETLAPMNEGAPPAASTGAPAPATRVADAQPAGLIPVALRGRWTGINDSCGDKSAELELTITPKSLIFHESVGTVQEATPGAGGRLRVNAAFTGEGDSWTKRLELRPSANGRELTLINDGEAVTRKRC